MVVALDRLPVSYQKSAAEIETAIKNLNKKDSTIERNGNEVLEKTVEILMDRFEKSEIQ